MGVVGAPLQSIDAYNVPKLNPQTVFLGTQENGSGERSRLEAYRP